MHKTSVLHDVRHLDSEVARGDSLSARQTLETLEKTIPCAVAWVVSSFPRGSLQIIQPAKIPQSLLKAYIKGFHAEDRPTWAAILHNKALTEQECLGASPDQSRYYREFMAASNL